MFTRLRTAYGPRITTIQYLEETLGPFETGLFTCTSKSIKYLKDFE